MRRLFTTKEAAAIVGVSYAYFRKLVAEGKGPRRYKYGATVYRFDEQDLSDWMEAHREPCPGLIDTKAGAES